MKHDCFQLLDKAVRKGRARYECIECQKDVSMAWYYYMLAVMKTEK